MYVRGVQHQQQAELDDGAASPLVRSCTGSSMLLPPDAAARQSVLRTGAWPQLTVRMQLLGGFQGVLQRRTGAERGVAGSWGVSGSCRRGVEGLLGGLQPLDLGGAAADEAALAAVAGVVVPVGDVRGLVRWHILCMQTMFCPLIDSLTDSLTAVACTQTWTPGRRGTWTG